MIDERERARDCANKGGQGQQRGRQRKLLIIFPHFADQKYARMLLIRRLQKLVIASCCMLLPHNTDCINVPPMPAAFDLLRLERRMDDASSFGDETGAQGSADEPAPDACREQCNEQLRMGLDMVNAHSTFGSIGVPSVVNAQDLELFCKLDAAHDQCLQGCGYEVQFNMREFVCRRTRAELTSHLECYARAAPQMRRACGVARCGPYRELELSAPGIAHRCATLQCDLHCIEALLRKQAQCREAGAPALGYLRKHSQIQVLSWLRELLGWPQPHASFMHAVPHACARLLCGPHWTPSTTGNCTMPSENSEAS